MLLSYNPKEFTKPAATKWSLWRLRLKTFQGSMTL
jgi:hypothetical protein